MKLGLLIVALAAALPAQDSGESRVQAILGEISTLASRIDAGELTLTEARRKESQPDKGMAEVRLLLQKEPGLVTRVSEFVRSDKHPAAARMIALFATARPGCQELVGLHCSLLDDPVDAQMAQAVLVGYYIGCSSRDGEDQWREDLLEVLPALGCSANYRLPGQEISPPMRIIHGFDFNNAPKGVDYRPLLRSLLGFLEKDRYPALRWRITMAESMVKELSPMGPDRIRFAKVVATLYLKGGEGWRAALEALASSRGFCGPDQLEILGRGLAAFDSEKRTDVLGEVAQNWGSEVFRPPFRDYFDDAIEYMGKPRSQNEPFRSTEWTICSMLIRQSLDDSWAERLLIKSPSVTLRRKAANVAASLAQGIDSLEWPRFLRYLLRMLDDPDAQVRSTA
ncbi:MAG TPA: hypothetical protein VK661_06470, partial [Planctomycetota bacterium]|nr:hypothetical protein [Planctomycetota bacterium]